MATLREVLASEVQAEAECEGYLVVVSEPETWNDYKYTLTVATAGMPPHASHEFNTLDDVEAYIAAGEVLSTADLNWQATEGEE